MELQNDSTKARGRSYELSSSDDAKRRGGSTMVTVNTFKFADPSVGPKPISHSQSPIIRSGLYITVSPTHIMSKPVLGNIEYVIFDMDGLLSASLLIPNTTHSLTS